MQNMKNSFQWHRPFAELPVEACFLFFIYASAARARYQYQPPTTSELTPVLESVWNNHLFSECDLRDPYTMTRFLEDYFAPSASNASVRV